LSRITCSTEATAPAAQSPSSRIGKANTANEKALAWIRGSLFDLIEGDPEIIAGEVLAEVLA
jgi:hypothetical protein